MFVKSFCLSLVFLCVSFYGISQLPPSSPPAMSYAKEELRPLIDSSVSLCDYEGAHYMFKDSIIREFAHRYSWNEEQVNNAHSSIKYRYSNNGMFYNVFAFHSKEELLELINYYGSLSRNEIVENYRKLDRMAIRNIENSIKQWCISIQEDNK